MTSVAVCISVSGDSKYYWAARQAALSVLQNSEFDLVVCHGPDRPLSLPPHGRLHQLPVEPELSKNCRATPFLSKLTGFRKVLQRHDHSYFLLLDADAVLVRELTEGSVAEALGDRGLGMAEQTQIVGSDMERSALRSHFEQHTLKWFRGPAESSDTSEFHFFNSGVVLARRDTLQKFLEWALGWMKETEGLDHRVGEHMIADQDYFQYWANMERPEECRLLPWTWNHCRHWDDDFPRKEALILHFSFFCLAPALQQILKMGIYRRGWRRLGLLVERFSPSL